MTRSLPFAIAAFFLACVAAEAAPIANASGPVIASSDQGFIAQARSHSSKNMTKVHKSQGKGRPAPAKSETSTQY